MISVYLAAGLGVIACSGPRRPAWALSEREQETAGRIVNAEFARQYVASRVLVKLALSTEFGVPPAAIEVRYENAGRPYAVVRGEASTVGLSITHTEGLVACAVSTGSEVGLDAETTASAPRVIRLGDHFLSPQERPSTGRGPGDALDHWVVKEAFSKLLGLGLRVDFRTLRVSFSDGGAGVVVSRPSGPPGVATVWSPTSAHRLAVVQSSAAAQPVRVVEVRDPETTALLASPSDGGLSTSAGPHSTSRPQIARPSPLAAPPRPG